MVDIHPALLEFRGKLVPPILLQGYAIPVASDEKPWSTRNRIAQEHGLDDVPTIMAWGCESMAVVLLRSNRPESEVKHEGDQKLHDAFGAGAPPE